MPRSPTGKPNGRPPLFTSKEQVEEILTAYFIELNNPDNFTPAGFMKRKPTVCGLALALGMARMTLLEYAKKGEFSDTVMKYKTMVEEALEQRLDGTSPTGAIFNLKNNFSWRDTSETADVTERVNRELDEEMTELEASKAYDAIISD